MPISSTDIGFYHCATTAEGAGHGGAIVTTSPITSTINDVWDDVTSAQAAAGEITFRKVFAMLGAGAGASVLSSPFLWMSDTEGSSKEFIYVTTGTWANQSDLPSQDLSDVSTAWARPTASSAPLTLANLSSGSAAAIAIWQARVIVAGCAAIAADRVDFSLQGDTV